MAKVTKWDLFVENIPAPIRNKFIVTTIIFAVWMFFFDHNSVIQQFKLQSLLNKLESQKEFFKQEIEHTNQDRKELLTNDETLEKFAREHYFMKKNDEDIFIIIEE